MSTATLETRYHIYEQPDDEGGLIRPYTFDCEGKAWLFSDDFPSYEAAARAIADNNEAHGVFVILPVVFKRHTANQVREELGQ